LDLQTNGTTAISISASQVVTFANQPAYTGGTANGVLYLNASKVVTTGTALAFDGSNLNVGASGGGNSLGLLVSRGATTNFLEAYDGTKSFISGTDAANAFVKVGSLSNHPVGIVQANGSAIYIDTSKNVGVGTTSPALRMHVVGSNAANNFGVAGGSYGVRIENGITVGLTGSAITGVDNAFVNSFQPLIVNGSQLVFATSNTERARITSGGNLGLGTTVPTNKVSVAAASGVLGFSIDWTGDNVAKSSWTLDHGSGEIRNFAFTSYFPTFYSNNAERMRIDSNGILMVGTTSTFNSSSITQISGNPPGNQVFSLRHTGASPNGMYIVYSSASPNNSSNNYGLFTDNAGTRFEFRSNGGIANYQANNSNLSDRREKTNFAPAKSYLGTICAIPVQTFNYIDQNLEEDGGLTLGVVAQDVQAVAPELVMESNWASKDEEPKMRLSIYQTDLQYALMKCIQEQQAIIESLKARLDAANL
jgi:hypothetical protein